jgi:hypothetical protein
MSALCHKQTLSPAKSGKIGDGKIFVYGLDHVVRIRTGELTPTRSERRFRAAPPSASSLIKTYQPPAS